MLNLTSNSCTQLLNITLIFFYSITDDAEVKFSVKNEKMKMIKQSPVFKKHQQSSPFIRLE